MGGAELQLGQGQVAGPGPADAQAAGGLRPIKEFDQWLEKMGFSENGKLTGRAGDASVFMTK